MPQIIIHRGAHTIGGSCVEASSNGHRIIIDLGMPLMEKGGAEIHPEKLENPSVENQILPDVKGLYRHQKPEIDAVLISHAHMDHYGLLNFIHPSIPVYLSKGSQALIDIGKVFYPKQNKVFFDNFKIFEHWQPFEIGPFKIVSYMADHSAYDASSFLIKANGKKIFYSGDFRGHGRKGKLLDRMIAQPLKNVDCMLMEGTTIGGGHKEGFENETEVEKGLLEIFSVQKDVSFVMASGSNIDRLVSIYRAARQAGKTLVLDLYTYYVLDCLKKFSNSLPPHKNDHIRIFYIWNHADNIARYLGKELLYKYNDRKIEKKEILTNRNRMILKLPIHVIRNMANLLIQDKSLDDSKFIFSMWPGYMEKDARHEAFCHDFNVNMKKVHVSGHAYLDALKGLAEALNPKYLVPIHTLAADSYNKNFRNVVQIQEGEPFAI